MADELSSQVSVNEANLSRVIAWSEVADRKAGFILTLTLVMLGYLTSQLNDFFSAIFSKWTASDPIAAAERASQLPPGANRIDLKVVSGHPRVFGVQLSKPGFYKSRLFISRFV